jgi:hypothetical protein
VINTFGIALLSLSRGLRDYSPRVIGRKTAMTVGECKDNDQSSWPPQIGQIQVSSIMLEVLHILLIWIWLDIIEDQFDR